MDWDTLQVNAGARRQGAQQVGQATGDELQVIGGKKDMLLGVCSSIMAINASEPSGKWTSSRTL
jgi:hypothetical protein